MGPAQDSGHGDNRLNGLGQGQVKMKQYVQMTPQLKHIIAPGAQIRLEIKP